MWRFINFSIKPNFTTAFHPGIKFWLKSLELCRYILGQRIYSAATGSPGGYPEGSAVFLKYQNVKFQPSHPWHHSQVALPPHGSGEKVSFRHVTDYVGKSSCWFHIDITDGDHVAASSIITAATMSVNVDTRNRKAAKFDPQYRDFVNEKSQDLVGAERLNEMSLFEDFESGDDGKKFFWSRRASYNATDRNGHVNNSVFVTYCLQALDSALTSGLKSADQNQQQHRWLGEHLVTNVQTMFITEVKLGSVLDVKLWPDNQKPFSYRFVLSVAGKVVAQCIIQFAESPLTGQEPSRRFSSLLWRIFTQPISCFITLWLCWCKVSAARMYFLQNRLAWLCAKFCSPYWSKFCANVLKLWDFYCLILWNNRAWPSINNAVVQTVLCKIFFWWFTVQ